MPRVIDRLCQSIGAAKCKPRSGLQPFIVMTSYIHQCLLCDATDNQEADELKINFLGMPLHVVETEYIDHWLKHHLSDIVSLCAEYEVFIFR